MTEVTNSVCDSSHLRQPECNWDEVCVWVCRWVSVCEMMTSVELGNKCIDLTCKHAEKSCCPSFKHLKAPPKDDWEPALTSLFESFPTCFFFRIHDPILFMVLQGCTFTSWFPRFASLSSLSQWLLFNQPASLSLVYLHYGLLSLTLLPFLICSCCLVKVAVRLDWMWLSKSITSALPGVHHNLPVSPGPPEDICTDCNSMWNRHHGLEFYPSRGCCIYCVVAFG